VLAVSATEESTPASDSRDDTLDALGRDELSALTLVLLEPRALIVLGTFDWYVGAGVVPRSV
jgi:hypothetical protein